MKSEILIGPTGKTFYADIYIGLTPGYDSNISFSKEHIEDLIANYIDSCEKSKFAVNVQDITFIYPGGREPGVKIGLIQYPRFMVKEGEILNNALNLAAHLIEMVEQFRCTVISSDQSYLIENPNMPEEYKDRS